MRPALEVADIFRRHGEAFRRSHGAHLGRIERRVMAAIEVCRTPALGGHVEQCGDCGLVRCAYNSCRNRHCPKCQGLARAEWLEARQAELLPVPYYHVVFTLPAPAAEIAFQNKRVGLRHPVPRRGRGDARHRRRPTHLGAEIGAVAVLHTWGQTLQHHPHLHCIVPGGGLSPDRHAVGIVPARVLLAGAGALAPVPHAVPGAAAGGVHGRRIALLRRAVGLGRARRVRRASRCTACTSNGWSMPSARSPDPSRCWPISAAIPIASPSPTRRLTRLADGQVELHLEGLSPSRQDQGDDARCRRVHSAVPAARRAGWVPPHPPCRLPRQRPSHRQARAMPCFARSPDARPATAGELPRAHPPADRPRTRCLPGLRRRDAGARTAAAPATATCAVLVRQLMTETKLTEPIKTSCDADVRIGTVPAQADDGQIVLCPARPLCPPHHPEPITAARPEPIAHSPRHQSRPALASPRTSGASHTTPIASPPRGSVQSGFNEVAIPASLAPVSRDLTEASRFPRRDAV